jgi:hypothetical protein
VSVDGGTFTEHGWTEIGTVCGKHGTLNVKNGGVYNHLKHRGICSLAIMEARETSTSPQAVR